MKTKPFLQLLATSALVAVSACAAAAQAAVLNFTNNVDHLDVASLGVDYKVLPQFMASDPVWGVFIASPKILASLAQQKDGKRILQVYVSLLNKQGNGWDSLYGMQIPLDPAQAEKGYVTFPIIPATFDMDVPGLADILHKLPEHANNKFYFKVRIDRDENNFQQSGFYVDLSNGGGRYADWRKQLAVESAIKNRPIIEARTAATKNYKDFRTDDGFKRDLVTWWSGPAGQSSQILKTMTCSSDYSISRNVYGVVTDKRTCGLFVYQQAGKCYVEFRLIGYESLGGGIFEKQLRDFTTNVMRYQLGRETLFGYRRYDVDCSAFGR